MKITYISLNSWKEDWTLLRQTDTTRHSHTTKRAFSPLHTSGRANKQGTQRQSSTGPSPEVTLPAGNDRRLSPEANFPAKQS